MPSLDRSLGLAGPAPRVIGAAPPSAARPMPGRDMLTRTLASLQTPEDTGRRGLLRIGAAPATAALVVAFWLFTFAGAGWSLWHSRAATLREARMLATDVAAILAQNVRVRLDGWDMLITGAVEQLENDGLSPEIVNRLEHRFRERVRNSRSLNLVAVTDETGRFLVSSAPDQPPAMSVRERDFFIYHQTHPQGGRFVGAPVRSPLDGRWVIALARRWNRPGGAFGGVVIATTDLNQVEASYQPLDLGAHGSVSLWMPPGIAVARVPAAPDMIGRIDAPSSPRIRQALAAGAGTEVFSSTRDGIERLFAYHRVEGYDLVQFVGLSTAEILASWQWELQQTLAMLMTVVLATGFLGMHMIRLTRRRQDERHAYRLLADNATDMILVLDTGLVRRYVSPAAREILGYEPEALIGHSPLETVHPDDREQMRAAFEAVLKGAERRSISYRVRHRNGHWVWVDTQLRRIVSPRGRTLGIIGALRDATERKSSEQALETANRHLAALAKSDGLTGLANRRHFDEVLASELRRAERVGAPLALVMLDVDHFKSFNDHYGHPAGDACLRLIAEAVLASLQRPADLAARYGGEELALVLPETEADGAREVAERITAALRAAAIPHAGGIGGRVTVSIGIAVHRSRRAACAGEPVPPDPGRTETVDSLIAAADRALYAAKAGGRARIDLAEHPGWLEPAAD